MTNNPDPKTNITSMKWLHLFSILVLTTNSIAQSYQSNWDTYVMEVNKKPVSIIVDLGIAQKAPLKERPFAILVRTRLNNPDSNGLPREEENDVLNQFEDSLVLNLEKKSGAVYAGRFTQRGLREFYFYALDTLDYLQNVSAALKAFSNYQWLCMAKLDKNWTNYFEVLYPPPKEMEKIQNRRVIDQLRQNGDALNTSRKIDHFLFFKTKISRDEFLRALKQNGFTIEEMTDDLANITWPYSLQLSRNDLPDYINMDKVTLYLWELAQKHKGKYDGWKTYIVK
jgi:uncharacterized protein (TIGR01619 family)